MYQYEKMIQQIRYVNDLYIEQLIQLFKFVDNEYKLIGLLNLIIIILDTMIVKASFVQYARRALYSIILASKSDSASDAPIQPTNGELKTLSADAQRALWAQAFINCIKDQPPLFKELREQSLHERLLNMEHPFHQKLSKYVFTKEIQSEMKRYFMPKVGVSLPTDIYTQLRFEQAGRKQKQSKNISLTFYPTYTTTGHMFQKILQKRRLLLLYGRWGIGKSLSVVLCSLLLNHIDFYVSNYFRTKEFKQIQSLLSRGSVLYWSIIENETQQNILKKILYQNKNIWSKYNIKQDTFFNFKNFIQEMKERDLTEYENFEKEVYYKVQNRSLIIDQINVLAANKRQHRKMSLKLSYVSNQKKPILLQKGRKMDYFKDKIRETAEFILYNNSSNIQTSLIARKNSEPDYKLKIGDGHADIPIQSFKYEQRLSFEEQNIAFLELSQFFTQILQQFGTFSNEVEEQWKNEDLLRNQKYSAKKRFFLRIQEKFRKIDWNIAPNAVLIVKKIKGDSYILSNLKTSSELEEKITTILENLLLQTQQKFKQKIKRFVEKQIWDNSGDIVKTEKLQKNLEVKKQIIFKLAMLIQSQTKNNLTFGYVKQSFFQIRIMKRQNYEEFIDKEIFTVVKQHPKDIVLRAFIDPKYFLDSISSIIFTDFNTNLIEVFLPGQTYDKVKTFAEQKIGRFFERAFVNLMKSRSFYFKCHSIDQYFMNYDSITISNFVIDQKGHSIISLQEKILPAKQKMKISRQRQIVCIPEQFTKTNQTNIAFDFSYLQFKDFGETQSYLYHFFNLTVSLSSSYIEDKIVNFVKMVSNLKQIKNQPVQKQLELKNKISFYILGFVGKSKKLTKEELQKIFRKKKDLLDLLQRLEIKIYELKYGENILQKRNEKQILSKQIIKDLKTVHAIYKFYQQKQPKSQTTNKK